MPALRGAEAWLVDGLGGEFAFPPADSVDRSWEKWLWPGLMAAVFVLAMVIVEHNQPYHFTQDDALVGIQPAVLYGCRTLFAGTLPEWNPYQHMGIPSLSLGFSWLWYPPTYLMYAIARFLLGNEYLTMEVSAILHLFAACFTTYWAARKLGIRRSLSAVASLCFVLSGYWLIIGRGWSNTIPGAVWTPLLVVSAIDLERREVGWRWLAFTTAVITIFFTNGFPQYWTYPMMCYALSIFLLALLRRISLRKVLWVVAALMLSLSFIVPLLYNQIDWASDLQRPPSYGLGIEWGLLAILFPHPITHASFPGNLGLRDYSTQLYYSGTLFCLATFLAWSILLAYRGNRKVWAGNVWLFPAALMLMISLGPAGIVWPLMSELPILSKANNNPFRALAYFNVFAMLAGGVVVDRLLQPLRHPRRWELATVSIVALLVLYHASIARPALFAYGDKPYPALPKEMAALFDSTRPLDSGRIIGVSPRKYPKPGLALALVHEFPSVYSVLSYYGDDPLVDSKPLFKASYQRMNDDALAAALRLRHPLDGGPQGDPGTGRSRTIKREDQTGEPPVCQSRGVLRHPWPLP